METDSYVLLYGLFIVLPLKKIDRTIESTIPFCLGKWKELLTIAIVLPTIRFLKEGSIYRWISTIGYDIFEKSIYFVQFFDSIWITTLVIGYVIAVLAMYENYPRMKIVFDYCAIPIWFILLVYLSQFLPGTTRLIAVVLSMILIGVGLMVDVRERAHRTPVQTDECPRQTSLFTRIANVFNDLTHHSTNETETELPTASSTPYFHFVLWALVATKVYQLWQHHVGFFVFVVIYFIIKRFLILLITVLSEQETVTRVLEQIKEFLRVR